MRQIAEASTEQSQGLGKINSTLNNLDQTTPHNATMAEKTTAATPALLLESERLTETAGKFIIQGSQDGQGRYEGRGAPARAAL